MTTTGSAGQDVPVVRPPEVDVPVSPVRAIRRQKLSPRQLEKVLGVPQPRVSELLNGKISRMTADLLTKYLYRLGREVTLKVTTSGRRSA